MSNELTSLSTFTAEFFRHVYTLLPWFCGNLGGGKFKVDHNNGWVSALEAMKRQRPAFFGEYHDMAGANAEIDNFYDELEVYGENEAAMDHFVSAWKHAWKNRGAYQLRGHETKLMKYFNEIFTGNEHVHLPELLSMARLVDMDTVTIARSVSIANGWSVKTAFAERTKLLGDIQRKVFGSKDVTPGTSKEAAAKNPEAYKKFKEILKHRKHAAHIRLIEIFDENYWYPTVDSEELREVLIDEGLEEFLPENFSGRIGVQPAGYPLTFYTGDERELEMPPLNDVQMNENYGVLEEGKEYKIHPVADGTFYCQTSAMAGDSKVKYYTMDYKRRAREIKFNKIGELNKIIDDVRKRMSQHVTSDDRDTWVRALVCLIIDAKYARIGNMASANAKKKTYGMTTLLTKEHVLAEGDEIIMNYLGKHSQEQKHVFAVYRTQNERQENPIESLIADRLLELIAEKNEFLFTRSDGKPFTAGQVNEYFTGDAEPNAENGLPEGGAGSNCTVHNLRNYHATRIFIVRCTEFAKRRNMAAYSEVLTEYKAIVQEVADNLGNTPGICRKSYIDPTEQLMLFKEWGYRPPELLKRDVFVNETDDHYGIEEKHKADEPRYIYADAREKTSARRKKVSSR
ncbi:MAG: hypothetical protein KAJ07_02365 [Planctomycetes bacterium]|nr:hypothetical protein [Planctomycetota bacterium]